jgi:hypothetical protein
MPTAIVTINGRRAKLTGNTREEVQAKIDELTSQMQQEQQQAPTGDDRVMKEGSKKASILDILSLAGTTSARSGGRQLAEGASGMLGNVPKAIPAVKESLNPETAGEKVSLAGANIAGAMSPVSPLNVASAKIATAIPKALGGGLGAQALGYATAGAVENLAFMPENTEEYLDPSKMAQRAGVGAVMGTAVPAVAGGLGALARGTGKALQKAPKKLVDEVIATKQAHLKFGKDPARAILDKKIKSKDFVGLDDLYKNVNTEIKATGESLDQAYTASPAKFDLSEDVVAPIKKAMREIKSDRPSQGEAELKKVQQIFDDIGIHKTDDLTAQEAWNLQKRLGSWVKWTTVDDTEKAGNVVIRDMYRAIRGKLEESMPELRKLNQDYSDLLTAQKAIEQRNPVLQRANVFSPSALATGMATGMAEGATTGFDLGTVVAGLGSALLVQSSKAPAFKLKLAHAINNAGTQKVADVLAKTPTFKKSFMAMYGEAPKDVEDMVTKARQYIANASKQ